MGFQYVTGKDRNEVRSPVTGQSIESTRFITNNVSWSFQEANGTGSKSSSWRINLRDDDIFKVFI